jgi:hypothetical protein
MDGGQLESKKLGLICAVIGALVLLLFLPFSPPAASSQLSFVFFLAALGVIIIELWMLAPALAPFWKKYLIKFYVGILLCIFGVALAIQESIHYRDISFLPLSAGITVLIISIFREIVRIRSQISD